MSTDKDSPTPFFIVVDSGSWNFSAEIFDGSSALICSFETTGEKDFTANQILNMSAKKVGKFYPGTDSEGLLPLWVPNSPSKVHDACSDVSLCGDTVQQMTG